MDSPRVMAMVMVKVTARTTANFSRFPTTAILEQRVFEAATHGDPRAQEIIERLGKRLATVALVVGTLLDVSSS